MFIRDSRSSSSCCSIIISSISSSISSCISICFRISFIVIFIIVQIYLILVGLIKRLGVEARVVPSHINYYVQVTKKK